MPKIARICPISPETLSSEIQKADNKPKTSFFALYFPGAVIAYQSASRLDLHPAGLEPATL
jgi:hypothetical protein